MRTEIEQIKPSHADHISGYRDRYIDAMFHDSDVMAQRKYDGERMLVHFLNGKVYCTSRHISKKTGKYAESQNRLVDLPTLPDSFGYTVIDCECYANSWSEIASVLHSLPDRARALQDTIKPKFAVFDVLFINGEDVRDQSYSTRSNLIYALIGMLKDDRFHAVSQELVFSKEEAYALAKVQWDMGREGIVIKPMDKAYYDKGAMLKIKRFETVDVVVYDFQTGTGKNADTVGALLVGYYDPESDTIKHISNVNCGTDADRGYWKEYFNSMAFKPVRRVLEVKCQEVTDSSLRHPAYVRIRDDKDYKECTRETIFKESI